MPEKLLNAWELGADETDETQPKMMRTRVLKRVDCGDLVDFRCLNGISDHHHHTHTYIIYI